MVHDHALVTALAKWVLPDAAVHHLFCRAGHDQRSGRLVDFFFFFGIRSNVDRGERCGNERQEAASLND